jgi:hypothetical protein
MERKNKKRRENLPDSFSQRYFNIDEVWEHIFDPKKPIAKEVAIVVFAENEMYIYLNGASLGCSEEGTKVKLGLHQDTAAKTCKKLFSKVNFFVSTLKNTPESLSEIKKKIAKEFGNERRVP